MQELKIQTITKYYQGVIEADGTPVESKVIRDFRIIETEGDWMKPGYGYWLV